MGTPSRRSGTPRIVGKFPKSCRFTEDIFRISEYIWNLNRLALQQNSAAYTAASWCIYQNLHVFIELGVRQ